MANVAILGFGRLGRQAFWQLWGKEDYQITAIYDITDISLVSKIIEYDAPSRKVIITSPETLCIDGVKVCYRQLTKKQCQDLDITGIKTDILLDFTLIKRTESQARKLLSEEVSKIIYLDRAGNLKVAARTPSVDEIELTVIIES